MTNLLMLYLCLIIALMFLLTAEISTDYSESENVIISNPNPLNETGDCAVRMVCNILNVDWDTAYDLLSAKGKDDYISMNNRYTSTKVLIDNGYKNASDILCHYRDKLTFEDFIRRHDNGRYALYSDNHVVAVIDGKIHDAFDSHGCICNYVVYGDDLKEEFENDEYVMTD